MEEDMTCPFCGRLSYHPTRIKKNKTITCCANNKCPIFGVNMTLKTWNTRTLSEYKYPTFEDWRDNSGYPKHFINDDIEIGFSVSRELK